MPAICRSDPSARHRIANNIPGPWPAVGEHRRNWAPLLCRSHLIFSADSGCGNLCLHLFKSMEIKESRPTRPPPPLPPASSLLPLFTSATGFIQSSAWVLSPLTRLNHRAHKPAAAEQNSADDTENLSCVLHVHQNLVHPSGERHVFLFFIYFPSQNQRRETQQLFPGLA